MNPKCDDFRSFEVWKNYRDKSMPQSQIINFRNRSNKLSEETYLHKNKTKF